MGGDLLGHDRERVLTQLVVVIEQGYVLASRQAEGAVAGGGGVSVRLAQDDLYPRIARRVLENTPNVSGGRSIVGDAELPIRIELGLDAFDGAAQPLFGRVVDRHDHREARPVGHAWDGCLDRRAGSVGERIELTDPG